MLKRTLITAAVMLAVAGPVLASSCPRHINEIDNALKGEHTLSAEQLAKVQALRKEGERLHMSGDHGASELALYEAKKILGLQ